MFASVALITFYDSKCSHVMLCWAAFSLMIVGYLLTLLCRISNGRSRGSSSLLLVAFVFVRDGIYRLTHSTQHSFSSRCHLRIPHGACGTALQGTARCETGMHDLASLVPLFVDVWTSGVHMFFFPFLGRDMKEAGVAWVVQSRGGPGAFECLLGWLQTIMNQIGDDRAFSM